MASCPTQAPEGNLAAVLSAARDALSRGQRASLAVVLETEGSTYSRPGAAVLFGEGGQVGWLSGGCLEPEIEQRALAAARHGHIDWMEIDTRDDDALFSGGAVGCRGRQRIVLLPLNALPDIGPLLGVWLEGDGALTLQLDGTGNVVLQGAQTRQQWRLPDAQATTPAQWHGADPHWSLAWPRRPQLLLVGAGPEALPLHAAMTGLGWRVHVQEQRDDWQARFAVPSALCRQPLAQVLHALPDLDAVIVMQHNFERDRDALEQLALHPVPFVGLLGPQRRREDLFTLLPGTAVAALQPRLRSPVGLSLGGRGPDAIALSIAAQLQAWRHGSPLAAA